MPDELTTAGALPASLRVSAEEPDRNLALELVRVTEAAAMARSAMSRSIRSTVRRWWRRAWPTASR